LAGPWLKALARACELAQADRRFAQGAGGLFGGFDVRPSDILAHIWTRYGSDWLLAGPTSLSSLGRGRLSGAPSLDELVEWQVAWLRSVVSDPVWHARWLMDVQRKSLRLMSTLDPAAADPRAAGLLDGQASKLSR
jgi:hypothetical protein